MTEDQLPYHQQRALRKAGLLPPLETRKPKKYLNKVSPKRAAKIAEERKAGGDEALDKWFDDKMKNSAMICENCGKLLQKLNEVDWRGSQHHVLEKSLYPSVATHPENHLVLGRWCCHPQWHTSWSNAAKMKIFPKAISIIKILYPLLTREEKGKLPDVVIQEIPPAMYNK